MDAVTAEPKTERLMLLDGNGLLYRAYFALPPLTTSRGELVNAVFGFCSIVLRGFQDVQPEYVAVAFDLPGPTFRHDRFAEYKATRQRMPDDLRDQFPKVREVVRALQIPVFEVAGLEADDVIGTLTLQAEALGLDTTIVTGDLDMLQIVTDRTRLMTTRSGVQNTIVYDPARIAERYGLAPAQMIDFKALKGDATDNIPGVPGIGEKTAAKLIAAFGGFEAMYERIDEVTPERLRAPLLEAHERIAESRELMRIVRDAPVTLDLAAARLHDYDREAVVRLFREYEFRTLIERLPPLRGERADETVAALRVADGGEPLSAARVASGRPIGWGPARADGASTAADVTARTPGAGPGGAGPSGAGLGVGTSGSGPEAQRQAGRPRSAAAGSLMGQGTGLQLSLDFTAVDGGAPTTTPAAADGSPRPPASTARAPLPADVRAALVAAVADPDRQVELLSADAIAGLEPWLAAQPHLGAAIILDDPRPAVGSPIAVAFAGADGRVVAAFGAEDVDRLDALVERLDVPLVGHEVKSLLARRLCRDPGRAPARVRFDTQVAAYLLNASLRSQTIADVVAEQLDVILPTGADQSSVARAGLGALSAVAAMEPLAEALAGNGLDRLFAEIELPLIDVLARMEATGVALDLDALATLEVEFRGEIDRLEQEIHDSVGHAFNLGSPKQLEQVLFGELNLPKGRKTKTGYSTDASVLEDLRGVHPMVERLLEWRTYTKLRSTYVEALPGLMAPDGRLHTTFHQAVAATGRLSSSDPNLQNIPIRTPLGRRIRRAFVAGGPDVTLVAADYSQIELRILAHVSGDEHLRDAFARGADIHRETAARVLHKEPADVTSDERSMAKMVNFGIAYGMSDFGLSARAGIPRQEAQEFINTYFATYSGISYYMLHIRETARQQGYVSTLLGRRRSIPELEARNPSLRAAGERMAINMPIQGTAADIIKIAMIRLADRLRDGGFRSRLLLQVHDELLLEVPRTEVDRLVPLLRSTMESALALDVPLTVDIKVGDSWDAMTPLTRADAIAAEASEAMADVAGA